MLFLIDLPYAIFWGLLAAVLRFVPYVGPWVAALMPTALGLAAFRRLDLAARRHRTLCSPGTLYQYGFEPLLYADSVSFEVALRLLWAFDVALGPHRSGYGNALDRLSRRARQIRSPDGIHRGTYER